ncbi:MAG: ribosome biogenesis GTPase Der [Chloroflexi bacterium]|nr:ribosome biogenesis GTPase Der [Chloroflexota bacterium]
MIAIVGRPNVGKSSLYNRLVGRRVAVVSDIAGTTRDRLVQEAQWEGRHFLLVDTGGVEPEPQSPMAREVQAQVALAMEAADAIIFLGDVQDGVTPVDMEIADRLRRTEKPVVLAVNKADSDVIGMGAVDFYSLGVGDPIAISAYHNRGIGDLMSEVLRRLPPGEETKQGATEDGEMALAILGRTNVGKSSLLNAILGEQRAIVSEVPGTTRDAIDTPATYEGQRITLIDTAGIRRRGHVEPGIEQYSVLRSMMALARADVALLVLDATELGAAQDQHIAGEIADAYKGVVVVVNKWDVASSLGLDQADAQAHVRDKLKFLPYAPIRFASALTGANVKEVMDAALMVYEERHRWVDPDRLRSVVWDAMAAHQPPAKSGRLLRVDKVVQEGVAPIVIAFYVNDPDLIHFSYQRYLQNSLRDGLGFRWSHLKLMFNRRERR